MKAQTHDATYLAMVHGTRFFGGVTIQYVAGNDTKVELDSTSATVAHNYVTKKVVPCVWSFSSIALFVYESS